MSNKLLKYYTYKNDKTASGLELQRGNKALFAKLKCPCPV